MASPFHDFICSNDLCKEVRENLPLTFENKRCPVCKSGKFVIWWRTEHQRNAQVRQSERAVIYVSDKERKIQYPGRADRPLPKRLEARGYRRVELTSAHQLHQLERKEKVVSHILNYDRGSGRSFDGSDSL